MTLANMNWLDKLLPPKIKPADPQSRKSMPEGLWIKCPCCEAVLYRADVQKNLHVCPKCAHHMRIGARARLDHLLDAEGRYEIGQDIAPVDALKFKDSRKYTERLKMAARETGETMGSVVGERFVRGVKAALDAHAPFICIAASGGARMQESMLSLMQMAKTTAMLPQLSAAGLPFISVLTDPTMGGVSASFAFLGDIVIAEPKALIGFAGPRVIEQTVRETLPEGFQRAEFLLQKGAIDMIIDRRHMRDEIARLIALLTRQPEVGMAA